MISGNGITKTDDLDFLYFRLHTCSVMFPSCLLKIFANYLQTVFFHHLLQQEKRKDPIKHNLLLYWQIYLFVYFGIGEQGEHFG